MKNIILTFALLICTFLILNRVDAQFAIPEPVVNKFTSLYPETKFPEWEMEDDKYEASFRKNEGEISVVFLQDGNVYSTETEIDLSALPTGIHKYLSTLQGDKKIEQACRIDYATGVVNYEVELGDADYLFDVEGMYLSMEQESSDDLEEDNDEEGDD